MNPGTYNAAVACLKEYAGGTPAKQIEKKHGMAKRSFYMLKTRFKRLYPDVFKVLLQNVESNTLPNVTPPC